MTHSPSDFHDDDFESLVDDMLNARSHGPSIEAEELDDYLAPPAELGPANISDEELDRLLSHPMFEDSVGEDTVDEGSGSGSSTGENDPSVADPIGAVGAAFDFDDILEVARFAGFDLDDLEGLADFLGLENFDAVSGIGPIDTSDADQSSWFPMPANSDPSTPADQSSWMPMGADPSAGMADADDANDQTFDAILGTSGSTGGAAGTDSNWSTLFDKLDKIIAILEKGSTSGSSRGGGRGSPFAGAEKTAERAGAAGYKWDNTLFDGKGDDGGFLGRAAKLLGKAAMAKLGIPGL